MGLSSCDLADRGGPLIWEVRRRVPRPVFAVDGLKDQAHSFRAVKVSGEVMLTDAIRYTVKSVK